MVAHSTFEQVFSYSHIRPPDIVNAEHTVVDLTCTGDCKGGEFRDLVPHMLRDDTQGLSDTIMDDTADASAEAG